MNSRTRLIILLLGVVALGGLLAAGWFFIGEPYLARLKGVEKAEREARDAEDELADLQFKSKNLKELISGSLPAGPLYPDDPKRQRREYSDVAKQEYEQALVKILKDAGARNSTVNYVDGESNNKTGIPYVDPKAKAPSRDDDPAEFLTYTQIVFKIEIAKTDLGTLAEVLRRYYKLDLLQQITHLNVKHSATGDVVEDKRLEKDRNDLKVEIITRAIIVNGAPSRRTLTPAPNMLTALTGGSGTAVYQNSPILGRQAPEMVDQILVDAREYYKLSAKNPFHGPLPKYEEPPIIVKGGEPPPPPKPDLREYIRYTTIIHGEQGDEHSVDIIIKDKANQDEYHVNVVQSGEKVIARTTKFVFDNHKSDPSERKKKEKGYDSKVLDISRASTMRNKNEFTVYGVDTDNSLILGEKPTGLTPELPKEDKNPQPGRGGIGGGGFGGRPQTKPTLPPPDPKAAIIGGMVVTAPKAEKFYRWEYGTTLKQIVELSKPEAEKAIRRVQTRFLPSGNGASVGATTPDDTKVVEK